MGARSRDTAELTYRTERRWGPRLSWRCVYCGRIARTVDHFVPLDLGGSDDPCNLVPACRACNSSKMDHHPHDWMAAVGVPLGRRVELIWLAEGVFTASAVPPMPRQALDYDAAKALRRPNRAKQGS